jgi:hypothetical protein
MDDVRGIDDMDRLFNSARYYDPRHREVPSSRPNVTKRPGDNPGTTIADYGYTSSLSWSSTVEEAESYGTSY